MRLPRALLRIFIVLTVLPLAVPPSALAHLNGDAPPPLSVSVWVGNLSMYDWSSKADGGGNEPEPVLVAQVVSHGNHGNGPSIVFDLARPTTYCYDHFTTSLCSWEVTKPIYAHAECSPLSNISVRYRVIERDQSFAGALAGAGQVAVSVAIIPVAGVAVSAVVGVVGAGLFVMSLNGDDDWGTKIAHVNSPGRKSTKLVGSDGTSRINWEVFATAQSRDVCNDLLGYKAVPPEGARDSLGGSFDKLKGALAALDTASVEPGNPGGITPQEHEEDKQTVREFCVWSADTLTEVYVGEIAGMTPFDGVAAAELATARALAPTQPDSSMDHYKAAMLNVFDALMVYEFSLQNPMDVVFQVDMTTVPIQPGDPVTLNGSANPLPIFGQPGIQLQDNGNFPDQNPGDGIFAALVQFPPGTPLEMDYLFSVLGQEECQAEPARLLQLSEDDWDVVGGTHGPYVMPPRGFDRCWVTDKDIEVIFQLDADYFVGDGSGFPPLAPGGRGLNSRGAALAATASSVEIIGSSPPLDPGFPLTLLDDGFGADSTAMDDTFSVSVVFPEGTPLDVDYNFVVDGVVECDGLFPSRTLALNDVVHSTAAPQELPLALWNICSEVGSELVVGVPGDRHGSPGHMHGNPNPFRSVTAISFDLGEAGPTKIEIFDLQGRLVRVLDHASSLSGPQSVEWDARDDRGQAVSPGVYYTRATRGERSATSKLVFVR